MECNIAVKKQYKLLLSIFIIQIFVFSVLGEKRDKSPIVDWQCDRSFYSSITYSNPIVSIGAR